MSAKVKIFSIISAFILVLGIMIIGVLSAEQVQVNIGGSVSFNATNVYARVTGQVQNAQPNPTLNELLFTANDNSSPSQTDLETWSNMTLNFDETPTPIVLSITVENLSTENQLMASLELDPEITSTGLSFSYLQGLNSYSPGSGILLPASSGDGTNTTTFQITLSVTNPDEDLTNVNFGFILNLYDESAIPAITGFEFDLDEENGTATVTDYTGSGGAVNIPATISTRRAEDGTTEYILGSDYTVTAIADGSYPSGPFYSAQSTLTSITIPETITSIGQDAFYECTALTEVEFTGNSLLTTIGSFAFYGCSSLTSITIPSSVESIDYNGFGGCGDLTSVNFGENSQLTTIGDDAFFRCSSLTSITIPSSVTTIGNLAFYYCSSLTSVNFGENSQLITIGTSAFNGCSSLTSIDFGDNSQLTTIGDNAFYGCSALTSITIPTIVTTIGNFAFQNCSSLTSIDIPASVTSIGEGVLGSCSALTSIEVNPDNMAYLVDEYGVLYDINKTILLAYPAGNTSNTSYTIPSSVTTIGDYAFDGCSSFTSVTFEGDSRLTTIGGYAFSRCSSLTSIVIPDSVTGIDSYAFFDCSSLTSITIPESVTSVDSYAFYGCSSLSEVTFENTAGWWVSTSSTATSGTDIPSSLLENKSTAATYLTSNYYNQYWHRS